jgi:cobyrinic acid a,c-diamide synthase
VIGGTGSGVGKTSFAVGLSRWLAREGLRVQTFKVGPDFLDPTYLAMASGRTCYNLDGWMTSHDYVRRLFDRATADADIAVIEGVMGLFDGTSPRTLEGSTAEISLCLKAPALLVADAHGTARSLAATVKGFAAFEPGVCIAGVIANRGGSQRHRLLLADSLSAAGTAPLVGMAPSHSLPTLPGRHLGLVAADQANLSAQSLDCIADACAEHLDVATIVELARSAGKRVDDSPLSVAEEPVSALQQKVRLGIARDEAFHFYYADNLEAIAAAGAELMPFSPLSDRRLPEDLDGLYLGGGYPEVYAERLADNATMLSDIRQFAASGRVIYAECGGLMYLGRAVTTLDAVRYPLAGVLPLETVVRKKLNALGYSGVTLNEDSLWGSRGASFRGHEFHYSELSEPFPIDAGWERVYSIDRRSGDSVALEGFQRGRILASYVHGHFASRPHLIRHFLACCGGQA